MNQLPKLVGIGRIEAAGNDGRSDPHDGPFREEVASVARREQEQRPAARNSLQSTLPAEKNHPVGSAVRTGMVQVDQTSASIP